MTHGRGSSYTSFVGGLSLLVVALALYLSPVGGSTATHPNTPLVGQPGIISASSDVPPKWIRVHRPAAIVAKAPVQPKTLKGATSQQPLRQIIYVPTATPAERSRPLPTNTTTTTVPTQPNQVASFTVQTKSKLIAPTSDYWGVAINGVPQGSAQLNALDTEVGAAPSQLTWYQGWDQPFPAQTVQSSWQRGALPMITWESKPTQDTTPAQSDPTYALSNIISGKFDSYLQSFAQGVASTGLPVVIRLDQEMNGNWFPWSEGVNGNTSGQFAQMWQHVWNIFQAAGANSDVIWLWAPNRVDNLPHAPALSELYPGDAYVDWVGIDAYWRYTSEAPTFAAVFAKSIAALESVTNRSIYIAETAGIETDPTAGTDLGPEKVQFTTSLISSIQSNPRIIGFTWFDNVATSNEDNVPVTNDWRLDSDPANLLTFKTSLAAGDFTDGLMPSSGSSTQLTVLPPEHG